MSKLSHEFIERLPKTDLHVHLDGSMRIPTLIELAHGANVELPSQTESGLKETVFKSQYKDLQEYLAGFLLTVQVMQNTENLERIAYEFTQDNIAENVRYLEVRFAPQLHISDQLSMVEVLDAVTKGMDRAKNEHNQNVNEDNDLPFEYGIIVCALRWFNQHMSPYYNKLFSVMSYAKTKDVFAAASLELARAAVDIIDNRGLPIVGIDLAGAEAGNPSSDHNKAFEYAHDHFLKKTVHAGEAYGPESIFQALTACHANRIGHGTHLFQPEKIQDPEIADPQKYVHRLIEYIASTRTTIEVNLTSNLQTLPEIESVSDHPFRHMIDHNLSASICTDNRLVSNTTVTNELQLAVDGLSLGPRQLKNIIIAGFKGSFFPGSYTEKRMYVRKVLNRYEALEKEFNL